MTEESKPTDLCIDVLDNTKGKRYAKEV